MRKPGEPHNRRLGRGHGQSRGQIAELPVQRDGEGQRLKVTTAFDNARVKGQKDPVGYGNKVTIRLQGIDAPELHFAALLRHKGLKNNGTKYRQFEGETSTVALGTFLKQEMTGASCRVLTRVDHPNDVFDMYGRLIGDVFVQTGATESCGAGAYGQPRHLGDVTGNTALVDLSLVFRPKEKPKPAADVGPVMMPKLFRRRIRFIVSRMNHLPNVGTHFTDYLSKNADGWATRMQFLADPAMKHPPQGQSNLGSLVDAHDMFSKPPGDLVFFEAASTLVDKGGKPITHW